MDLRINEDGGGYDIRTENNHLVAYVYKGYCLSNNIDPARLARLIVKAEEMAEFLADSQTYKNGGLPFDVYIEKWTKEKKSALLNFIEHSEPKEDMVTLKMSRSTAEKLGITGHIVGEKC